MQQVTRGYIEVGHGSARGKYRATLHASGLIHTDKNDSPGWDPTYRAHISQCQIGEEIPQDPATNATPVWWSDGETPTIRGYSVELDSAYEQEIRTRLEKEFSSQGGLEEILVEELEGDSNGEQALTKFSYRGVVIYQFCRTCRSSFCKCPGVMKYCGY